MTRKSFPEAERELTAYFLNRLGVHAQDVNALHAGDADPHTRLWSPLHRAEVAAYEAAAAALALGCPPAVAGRLEAVYGPKPSGTGKGIACRLLGNLIALALGTEAAHRAYERRYKHAGDPHQVMAFLDDEAGNNSTVLTAVAREARAQRDRDLLVYDGLRRLRQAA